MEAIKDLIINNKEIAAVLLVIYILGFIFKITKDIFKEKKK